MSLIQVWNIMDALMMPSTLVEDGAQQRQTAKINMCQARVNGDTAALTVQPIKVSLGYKRNIEDYLLKLHY